MGQSFVSCILCAQLVVLDATIQTCVHALQASTRCLLSEAVTELSCCECLTTGVIDGLKGGGIPDIALAAFPGNAGREVGLVTAALAVGSSGQGISQCRSSLCVWVTWSV